MGDINKKVAILTFHASHNYGSVLQAYALQTTIENIGCYCDIINLRTMRQEDKNKVFTKKMSVKYLLKNMSHALYYTSLKKKYENFEQFINNYLNTTDKTYRSLADIQKDHLEYDYYICGSDQIWNPVPVDFDWAYYLPFVKKGKKISYATSFGQLGNIDFNSDKRKIAKYVSDFDNLSVREKKSQQIVKGLTGRNSKIVLDPTLLLNKFDWDNLTPNYKRTNNNYILLYTLFADRKIMEMAYKMSKYYNLPVVTTKFTNQYDVFTTFKKKYDTGPLEFLSLVKDARIVVTTSFHGTVFSIIYKKPFFAVRGNLDARINNLLKTTNLADRSIDGTNFDKKIKLGLDISYSGVDEKLNTEKNKSLSFIKESLEVGGE